jgi:hypothetical protein
LPYKDKAREAEYQRQYYQKHKKRLMAMHRQYVKDNVEEVAEIKRRSYEKHKEKNREEYRRRARLRKQRQKMKLLQMHGTTECTCGESRPWCLVFHHRNPADKLFCIGNRNKRTEEELRRELRKCDVLCHNCHTNLHYEEINNGKTQPTDLQS